MINFNKLEVYWVILYLIWSIRYVAILKIYTNRNKLKINKMVIKIMIIKIQLVHIVKIPNTQTITNQTNQTNPSIYPPPHNNNPHAHV
jgi:hypothetical protein